MPPDPVDASMADGDEASPGLPLPPPSPIPAEGRQPMVDRLLAACRSHGFLVPLLVFALVVRLTRLPMIEVGGDAVKAWFNAKQLTYGLAERMWEWDHHSVRFAIIIPAWFFQQIFGTGPVAYYVMPLAIALLQVGLLWAIGVRIGRPAAGVIAAIGVCLFPQMSRAGSQILSEAPSAAYALLATYFLLRYRDDERRRGLFAALVAVALFIGYLTKITNVLFVPGFALAMWLIGRRARHVATLLGLLLGLFLLETLIYRLTTKYSLGQLSIISGSHLSDRRLRPTPLKEFFVHVLDMTPIWKVTLGAFAAAMVIAAARWRRWGRDVFVIALLPATFLLLQNFAVKSVDPIIPVQRFLLRYMLPALPHMMLIIAWVISVGAERVAGERKVRWWVRPVLGAAAMAAVAMTVVRNDFPGIEKHPFTLLRNYQRTANAAFGKGTPVVGLTSPKCPTFFVRMLWSGLTGKHAPRVIPELRKAKHGRKNVHFVLHPKHLGGYRGQKNQAIFDAWLGREVIQTGFHSAEGRDMGALFDLQLATLRDPSSRQGR